MEDLLRTAGISFMIGFLALLLKDRSPQSALMLAFCGSVYLINELVVKMREAAGFLTQLTGYVPGLHQYSLVLLKVVVIAFVSEICIHLVKQLEQPLLSMIIEWTGKLLILTIAFPVFIELLEQIVQLMPENMLQGRQ
ncbi:stage III sporulation AC/AD family protein [Jeotgalibacillus terrae]|uniref:Stage III sporulation AC/AD family protein n=1 Tax=Jeotgalibacillus terrae TaxID=587735 RepID=A0ABW5ZKW4_9BACL|nr:stage III sporulation AC/AD family protein [Jeotgalibacillus terrae]MBM7577555.1 stage III sporulation protein AD [Jeotgalibacillus terrae]